MPGIELIDGPPNFTTPEQHAQLTSATPDSFNDIPPVARHIEQNVTCTLEPPLDGAASTNARGTLYVTERVLAFVPAQEGARGFSTDYPTLILHAISRGEEGPMLYCQLDESIGLRENEDDDPEAEFDTLRELKIVPSSPDALEPIFEAISICASLNADPYDGDDDDAFIDAPEGGGSAFPQFNGDDEELSEVGRAALAHLESIIDWDHPASGPRPAHLQQQQNGTKEEGEEEVDKSA
ncbi:hypothetical protein EXIGLDRAFT_664760 [Exidia glandulosa HHB12029]|uniref:Regulator of volume decrease after cellular swelling-domain-containing protein n=1 Tax=Exidia glandulosa HHB12029 TaxID=1314781 RepID=A0A165PWP9_EXIGL|nr:hypothetical protein EXIGLDRAFT_664760 [Exidia glandulosa HHB12029]